MSLFGFSLKHNRCIHRPVLLVTARRVDHFYGEPVDFIHSVAAVNMAANMELGPYALDCSQEVRAHWDGSSLF